LIDERQIALARMTSPEAGMALAQAEVAIIPVGATEHHGPNMSLETDTAIAYQLSLRIAEAIFPRAVVTPPMPFGISYHHMRFPGTLTVSPDTQGNRILLNPQDEQQVAIVPTGSEPTRLDLMFTRWLDSQQIQRELVQYRQVRRTMPES
jgi:creatinine amidohydrolase